MATITKQSSVPLTGSSSQPTAQLASDSRTQVVLRPMAHGDISQVVQMDRISFPSPWPSRTYEYEIGDTDRARMFVVEPAGLPPVPASNGHQRPWWERLLGLGNGNGQHQPIWLCGYSGMWHIADEAHISTIAIHPQWRGRKLGELLVWAMARQAVREGAVQLTLEVRVSNEVARSLYKKYGFEVMGLRKGYYRDNHEDAFMMAVQKIDESYRERLFALGKELARTLQVTDHW
jgi:[ribosomal protein S18]-alanine N-acetyltransferase